MSKSNKYKIYYRFTTQNHIRKWIINIKKLNLTIIYQHNIYNHLVVKHLGKSFYKSANNFIIEPELITMLKSNDNLTINVAFEILNNRLNERTK